jgi:hypothetical protein
MQGGGTLFFLLSGKRKAKAYLTMPLKTAGMFLQKIFKKQIRQSNRSGCFEHWNVEIKSSFFPMA